MVRTRVTVNSILWTIVSDCADCFCTFMLKMNNIKYLKCGSADDINVASVRSCIICSVRFYLGGGGAAAQSKLEPMHVN